MAAKSGAVAKGQQMPGCSCASLLTLTGRSQWYTGTRQPLTMAMQFCTEQGAGMTQPKSIIPLTNFGGTGDANTAGTCLQHGP